MIRKIQQISYIAATVLLAGGLYMSFELGFLDYLWTVDISKLSFIILLILLVGVGLYGILLFKKRVSAEKIINLGYELSDTCMSLGMLGTVIGFIVMTISMASSNVSNIDQVKQLIQLTTTGLSTALFTTAAGLITNIVLRALFFHAEHLIDGDS